MGTDHGQVCRSNVHYLPAFLHYFCTIIKACKLPRMAAHSWGLVWQGLAEILCVTLWKCENALCTPPRAISITTQAIADMAFQHRQCRGTVQEHAAGRCPPSLCGRPRLPRSSVPASLHAHVRCVVASAAKEEDVELRSPPASTRSNGSRQHQDVVSKANGNGLHGSSSTDVETASSNRAEATTAPSNNISRLTEMETAAAAPAQAEPGQYGWLAFWVGSAVAFGAAVWLIEGDTKGKEFFAGAYQHWLSLQHRHHALLRACCTSEVQVVLLSKEALTLTQLGSTVLVIMQATSWSNACRLTTSLSSAWYSSTSRHPHPDRPRC